MSTPPSGLASLTQRAVSGVLWLSLLNSAASLFVLGLWAYLNRALPDAPGQMGLWLFVLKLLLFTHLVFEGGFTAVLKQRKGLGPGEIRAIGRIQAGLGLVGGASLFLLAPVIAPHFRALPTPELTSLLRLASPVFLIVSLGLTQKALMERELSFRRVALIESSSTLLFVGVGVFLGRELGAEGLVIATILRHLVETLLYWLLGPLRRSEAFAKASWTGMASHVRYGGSILAQSLLGNLMRHADVLIAGILLTVEAVNAYAQIQLFIALPLSKITMYAARVSFPTFAHVQDDPQRLVNGLMRLQRLTALAVFPALAGLVAVGPRFFWLYLGPEYHSWLRTAWLALLVLCIGAGAYAYAYGVAVVVNAVGGAQALLKRQVLGAALVVASVFLGGLFGFLPMSAARSLAIAIAGLLFLALGRKLLHFGWRAILTTLRPALPAAVSMGLLVAGLGELASWKLPASDPFTFEAASAGAVASVLAGQVLLGALAYLALLALMGFDLAGELRAILARSRAVAAPSGPG